MFFRHIFIFLIRLYQSLLSPAKAALFGASCGCRFTPSCSHYALEALQTHGVGRGLWLATVRLGRCHPWGGCGWDPVPAPRDPSPLTTQKKPAIVNQTAWGSRHHSASC